MEAEDTREVEGAVLGGAGEACHGDTVIVADRSIQVEEGRRYERKKEGRIEQRVDVIEEDNTAYGRNKYGQQVVLDFLSLAFIVRVVLFWGRVF